MQRLSAIAVCLALLCTLPGATGATTRAKDTNEERLQVPGWTTALERALDAADARYAGELGVYVRHLDRDESFSYRAEEPWYLASGVKVPVAIAVLRAVARGELALDTRITLREDDFVDGAGATNGFRAGSRLRVSWLLEQMIVHSDNTASDVLIRAVGIDAVNAVAAELTDAAGVRITTLADVRRLAYGELHPAAATLRSTDLLALKRSGAGQARVRKLVQLLQVPPEDLRVDDLDTAFEAYYATHVNSASLVDFGRMLAALADGHALPLRETTTLLDLMARVQTGQRRLRAGLPSQARFAHKTGTQHRRICDLGIATVPATRADAAPARVVIAACARGTGTAAAERALRDVGAAVTASGIFMDAPPRPTVSPPDPA
ncbi:class A beta-lactamase-related serine hydrolase [Luteimonas kalidii]|uniref:Class A beta-lactamase-related serine hydrolase n=1 Tax=Luteimonas kalidii TaxID=3042025 RepID=A0ABT6JRC6_9GAMM|nr:class A beta-lactamase-related serine hydrolase [Luteimonas kalidii]MDH5832696.1 class A beta-lactamase-related serine hydrolase [Luteimonas kalidii]